MCSKKKILDYWFVLLGLHEQLNNHFYFCLQFHPMTKAQWTVWRALTALSPCCARGAVSPLWQTCSAFPRRTALMMSASQLRLARGSRACLSKTTCWRGTSPSRRANLSSLLLSWLDSQVCLNLSHLRPL